ncbi:MAG: ribokinase [Hespellia sp.]|nr:ribokinase [Hespellia sp.]
MMRILNFGSLNVDKIYSVDHLVKSGETIKAFRYKECCGGKGLNQSIALARAGAMVCHAGSVGNDGGELLTMLEDAEVSTSYIKISDKPSGHAIIQVDSMGQNNIIIYGGANNDITTEYMDEVFSLFCRDDILLLQNEISNVDYAILKAKESGMKVVLNPSPINEELVNYHLECVDCFILNEIEGKILAGIESEHPEEIIKNLKENFPKAAFVLTLGINGSYYFDQNQTVFQKIYQTDTVDTTGAGDTFCGYFLSCMAAGNEIREALEISSMASAIAVSQAGAAPSIPERRNVLHKLKCWDKELGEEHGTKI